MKGSHSAGGRGGESVGKSVKKLNHPYNRTAGWKFVAHPPNLRLESKQAEQQGTENQKLNRTGKHWGLSRDTNTE